MTQFIGNLHRNCSNENSHCHDICFCQETEHRPRWLGPYSDSVAWVCNAHSYMTFCFSFSIHLLVRRMYTFRICGLPAVTHNLVAMCRVSLHITGDRQGVRHQSHSVAKIFICRIQLELSFLGKTWKKKSLILTTATIYNWMHYFNVQFSKLPLHKKNPQILLPFTL